MNMLIEYFKEFRETWFSKTMMMLKNFQLKWILIVFPQMYPVHRKKKSDENSDQINISFFQPCRILKLIIFYILLIKWIFLLKQNMNNRKRMKIYLFFCFLKIEGNWWKKSYLVVLKPHLWSTVNKYGVIN